MDWAKTTARRDENHLSFVTWCGLYKRFYSTYSECFRTIIHHFADDIFKSIIHVCISIHLRYINRVGSNTFHQIQIGIQIRWQKLDQIQPTKCKYKYTLRQRQTSRYFTEDIFKLISFCKIVLFVSNFIKTFFPKVTSATIHHWFR